jgi:Xaa-Pro aminopeptidase
LYDGIALVKFFYWLEKNLDKNISEFEASKKLELFRRENKGFFSLSFPTISATGANGSIIHYKPKSKSTILKKSQLYLCDSGGQYMGATTDITRTIYLGDAQAPQKIKEIYTLVLLGHLNLSILKFPKGTKGFQIDSIARFELWKRGFDYNHGTGHGVGSFLGVHEGPQSISKSPINVALKPGMIISNEPGFYENKRYGIRIENLVLVKKSSLKNFYDFETLSLFPYEKHLINKNLLSVDQINWINNYHQLVFKKLSPYLEKEHKTWLLNKTEKISIND